MAGQLIQKLEYNKDCNPDCSGPLVANTGKNM